MSILPVQKGGKTYYTHSSWLSNRQQKSLQNIPVQNNRLSIYYTLSTLALSAVVTKILTKFAKKVPIIGNLYSRLGVYNGIGVLGASSYVLFKILMGMQTKVQTKNVIQANVSFYTPLWNEPSRVYILNQKTNNVQDAAIWMMRWKGEYNTEDQILKYNPDDILEHPKAKQTLNFIEQSMKQIQQLNKML